LPMGNAGLIPFTGFALRFLGRPVQTTMQESAHMIVMPANTKVTFDQDSDALTGPKMIGPTMRARTLKQQDFQAFLVLDRKSWRGTWMGFRRQALRLAGHSKPAVHGAGSHAKDAGHVLHTLALRYRLHGSASPLLQSRGTSNWSTH